MSHNKNCRPSKSFLYSSHSFSFICIIITMICKKDYMYIYFVVYKSCNRKKKVSEKKIEDCNLQQFIDPWCVYSWTSVLFSIRWASAAVPKYNLISCSPHGNDMSKGFGVFKHNSKNTLHNIYARYIYVLHIYIAEINYQSLPLLIQIFVLILNSYYAFILSTSVVFNSIVNIRYVVIKFLLLRIALPWVHINWTISIIHKRKNQRLI
jgi:hypothetical protein